MKPAAISGVNGPFTEADIRRVRWLALAARAKAAASAAKTKPPKTKPPIKRTVARRPKPVAPRQRLNR